MSCFNCKLTYPKYFNLNKKNYCYFCKLIYFLEQKDIYSVYISYSILDQDEIVKKTKEILLKENRIPFHTEIDPNSKIVLINPYIFLNVIKMMNQYEQMCFSNVKIFFTEDLNIEFIKISRMLPNQKPIKKSNEFPSKICIIPRHKVLYDKYLKLYLNKYL